MTMYVRALDPISVSVSDKEHSEFYFDQRVAKVLPLWVAQKIGFQKLWVANQIQVATDPDFINTITSIPTTETEIVGPAIYASPTKTDLDDVDQIPFADSDNQFLLAKTTYSNLKSLVATYIKQSHTNIASGLLRLDGGGKVPSSLLPSAVFEYQGVWNANTNTPTLANGVGSPGDVYRVSTAGTQNLGSGSISFMVGDYILYNTSNVWERSGTTDAVASINGYTGIVTLAKSDIGLGNVDNTADSTKNVSSATKLTTARLINNVSFDGTQNITIADSTKEPAITSGTTSQWWRGDKTWQGIDKYTVGLSNVDNTSDANKPVSTATQTALSGKANTSHSHAQSDITGLSDSLSGKANASHTHAQSDITNLTTDLAGKEPTITAGTGGQYWRGDKTWQDLNRTAVGLSNVDNTADLNKSVASATKLTTARNINGVSFDGTADITVADSTKEPAITAGTNSQWWRGDKTWQSISKTTVGLSNVDNTADADKPISSATQTALSGKEPTITGGTTSQFWRGDKSWQTLDKSAVGLSNADNTSDATKNSASATLTNKSISLTTNTITGTLSEFNTAVSDANLASIDGTETLTNKSISGTTNTFSNIPQSAVTDLGTSLGAKESTANKGQANGYASLDSGGKVPLAQLPSSIMEYQGVWNANTNTPTLVNGTGNTGDVYRVSVAGNRDLGSGTTTFDVGDYVIYNGNVWEKSDTTDSVISVNGYTGAVSLSKSDVGLGNVDNTSDSTKNSATATLTNKDLTSNTNTFPTFNQSTTGNAATATKLATARTINGASFDGSSNISFGTDSVTEGSTNLYFTNTRADARISNAVGSSVQAYSSTLTSWAGKTVPSGTVLGTTDTQTVTNKDLSSATNTFPTLNQNTTGNAATATKLETARNINGVAFDGTANITVADSTKEPTIAAGTTGQYWRGDKSWQTLDKSAVGLSSVDNTADSAKSVSSAAKLTTARNINGVSFDGTADITVADSTKEPTISSGTTGQYWRGDKSWQTLDKSAVGLGNVDNTSDATKNSASVTLTNKTIALGSNTISGTLAEFNTAVTDANLASIDGTETLTHKTLSSAKLNSPTLDTPLISGGDGSAIVYTDSTATNANLTFLTKGSGSIYLGNGSNSAIAQFAPASSGNTNYFTFQSSSTGGALKLWCSGSDTDVSFDMVPQGAGSIKVSGVPVVTTTATQTLTNKTLTSPTITTPKIDQINSSSGGSVLYTSAASNAVNGLAVYGQAANNPVYVGPFGSDTNIGLMISSKGTGSVRIRNEGQTVAQFATSATGVNWFNFVGNDAGYAPQIQAVGSDTNINLNLLSKGSGTVQANSVDVVTTTGTQSLSNKTISGASNTITNLPASATPQAARWVMNAANGGSGTEDGANTWAKLASFSFSTVQWTGGGTTLLIAADAPQVVATGETAVIAINMSQGDAAGSYGPWARMEILSKSSSDVIANDGFKLVSDGYNTSFDLWVKKINGGTNISVYEFSKTGQYLTTTYNASAPWQSATPTGTKLNLLTNGVTASGAPVVTTTATQTLTNKSLTSPAITTPKMSIVNDTNGNTALGLYASAGATSYVQVANGTSLVGFSAQGATDINMAITAKGAGAVLFGNGGNYLGRFVASSSPVSQFVFTSGDTGQPITLSTLSSDTNVSINLVPKGTGTVLVNNTTIYSRSVSNVTSNATTLGSTNGNDYVALCNISGDASASTLTSLLHFDGTNNSTTITDSSLGGATWTASGDAKLTTTSPKFGTACLTLDGSGDYVSASGTQFDMSGDFTAEFWARPSNTDAGTRGVFTTRISGAVVCPIFLYQSGANLHWYVGNAALDGWAVNDGGSAFTASAWTHIAIVATGSTLNMYVDGALFKTTSKPAWGSGSRSVYLGSDPGGAFNGQIDEFRFSKNVRYTTTFTSSSSAFPDPSTISLPTASGNTNKYIVKNSSSAPLYVRPNGSETIDGSTTASLTQNQSVELLSDGSNWKIVGNV